ncbi:MAG: hypothetical protein D6685_07525 [Bacteroidetes bacterium]|nr:MAG: hypothetical protein D6685_07525 [Bacteroidota bacterium]
MTSYQFNQHLEALVEVTSTESVLTKYVFILARGYDQITSDLTSVLSSRNRTMYSKRQQDTQEQFAEFRKHAETFPMGQVFHEVIRVKEVLDEMQKDFADASDAFIGAFRKQLDDFYAALEQCVRGGEDQAFVSLMMEAHHLYPMMTTARQLFRMVRRGLERRNPVEERADEAGLALVFEMPQTYEGVVGKLASVQNAYEELCRLMQVSILDHPLRLVKVETGSLWLSVRGHAEVVRMLTSLIERFTTFLQHRFSIKGKAADISERVIATQSLINLADELEIAGVTAPLEDEATLKQAALTLRRELTTLLAGEPIVRVNDVLYEVEEAAREQYIEQTRRLMPGRIQPYPLSRHGS